MFVQEGESICYGTLMEVRGQLVGIGPLGATQAARLGGKYFNTDRSHCFKNSNFKNVFLRWHFTK